MGVIVALCSVLFAGSTAASAQTPLPAPAQTADLPMDTTDLPHPVPPPDAEPIAQALGETAEPSMLITLIVYGVLSVLSILSVRYMWRHDILRAGSFARPTPSETRTMREPWHVPTLLWSLGIVLIFVAQPFGMAMAMNFPDWLGPKDSPRHDTLLYASGAAAAVLVAGVYIAFLGSMLAVHSGRRAEARGADLAARAGLRGGSTRTGLPTIADVGAGLGALALVLPICLVAGWVAANIAEWVSGREIDPIAHDMLRTLVSDDVDPWKWGLIAVAVLGAPIVEELLFRVFVQSTLVGLCTRLALPSREQGITDDVHDVSVLRAASIGRWTGIVFTSVLFAIMHLGALSSGDSGVAGGGYYALVPLFILSMGLGVAYERTGRWVVPMTMHAAFNALNVLLALTLAAGAR